MEHSHCTCGRKRWLLIGSRTKHYERKSQEEHELHFILVPYQEQVQNRKAGMMSDRLTGPLATISTEPWPDASRIPLASGDAQSGGSVLLRVSRTHKPSFHARVFVDPDINKARNETLCSQSRNKSEDFDGLLHCPGRCKMDGPVTLQSGMYEFLSRKNELNRHSIYQGWLIPIRKPPSQKPQQSSDTR